MNPESFIWVIDEVNVGLKTLRNSLYSETSSLQFDRWSCFTESDSRGLVSYYNYCIDEKAKCYFIGTSLLPVELQELKSGSGDTSKSIPKTDILVPSLIVDGDKAIDMLGECINLTQVPESVKQELKALIQGRLRRAFGFIS